MCRPLNSKVTYYNILHLKREAYKPITRNRSAWAAPGGKIVLHSGQKNILEEFS